MLCFLACKSRRDIVHSFIQANILSCSGDKMNDLHLGADSNTAGLGTGKLYSNVGRNRTPLKHTQGTDSALWKGELSG